MADKRELILDRLFQIAQGDLAGLGLKSAVRNRGLRDNEARPGFVLLDGDESPAIIQASARTNSRYAFKPQLVRATPQLFILMDEQRPTNEDAAAVNIGTKLNAKRLALCAAIAADAPLAALLGPNGGIVYNGCETDLKSGSPLSGQIRLDFVATYFFDPT